VENKNEEQTELFEILGLEEESDEIQHREKQWGTSVLITDETLLQEIKDNYKNDQELWEIIQIQEKTEKDKKYVIPKHMVFKTSNYRWDSREKLLFRKIAETERLCIPGWGTLRLNRLLEAHDIPLGGHFGREKTLANLAKNFFWPGMTKDVEDFVKSCNNCQRNKAVRRAPIGLLYPHDRPQARWEKIALDFIVQLPKTRIGKYDAILTVVDFFSRRTHFIPCHSNITAIQTAQLLREHVFKHHGYPKCIVSDRGSVFTSAVWTELFRCLKAKQNLSSSFHPQTDGITEKENDIIENCIRSFTNFQQDDWNEYLPDFELAINAAISDSTGISPFFLDVGREPFIPLSVTREIDEVPTDKSAKELVDKLDRIKVGVQLLFALAQEKQAKYANAKRRDIEFQEGDFVMLNSDFVYDPIHTDRQSRKLANKWLGPFSISKRISRVAYKLFIPAGDKIKIHPVIHIANLKKYVDLPERFINQDSMTVPLPIKDSQNESVFLVDDILDVRNVRNKREFLIKWTGYEDPSWEPEHLLRESVDFIPHLEKYLEQIDNGEKEKLKHLKNRRNVKARIK
jgi:hypothetical protein